MNGPVLTASSLYRFYHVGDTEIFALRGVNLELRAGEFIAVVGPSGSGKSTLLNCLAGLDDPSGGFVAVGGERISRRPERMRAAIRAQRMGIMMQSGNLFPHLRVIDNIRLQQRLAHKPRLPTSSELLAAVGLEHHTYSMPETLSGGEAARTALAVALSVRPAVLICDEPTGEVDDATEMSIIVALQRAQEDGTAIIVATHSTGLAGKADRIVELSDGVVK
jgi:putative ABC transport system ATP-binding protein